MTPANNILNVSLPSLAAIHHRRRELLSYQATQRPAQADAPLEEPLAVEDSYLEEDDRLAQDTDAPDAYDELEEDPEQPYPAGDPAPPSTAAAPPTLAESAFYGLAGLAVRTLAPHTEADPAAILLQFLAAFGNLVGPAPHCTVGSTRHSLNLFVVLVGESSKARKGTSWRQIAGLFHEADRVGSRAA